MDDSVSNIPLLEIDGEDDSLLLGNGRDDCDCSVTTATATATPTNAFSCSPLQLQCLRSLPPQTTEVRAGAVDSEMLSSSSTKDGVNKENMSWSKSDAPPKLSIERQQMKRKKKGSGGYNLRKSLAWDRAFFTEEGVLNPLELSMISGTATHTYNTTNSELNVINEEEHNTLVCTSSASSQLQEVEEDLFKQSSDVITISIEHRNLGARLSPKPADALTKDTLTPASLAKRKVLAGNGNDVLRNRPKRNACPRPVAPSSPDTTKAPSGKSKVTKIPGPKSNVSVMTAPARSGTLSTGCSKRNQSAHPDTNVQKYAGVKGLSKYPRTVASNPKVDLADRCSVTRTLTKQAGKHMDNSVSETHEPFRLHRIGTETNKISEACRPKVFSDASEKRQRTQFQTSKPSGLRMPSPSLGFFSQAKASSSHGQLQKSSKPCKPAESNIPKLRKFEANSVNEARLPHAPRKSSKIVKDATKNCTQKLGLPDVKSEPSMPVDNNQMAGIEVECGSLGSEKISKQEMTEDILEHVNIKSKEQAKLHKSENVSNMEGVEFPRHTHEQLEKQADHPLEGKLYGVLSNGDQSVFQEPLPMHHHSMQRTSTGKDNMSNTVHNTMGQDEDEQIKRLTCDIQTSTESLVLQVKYDSSSQDSTHSGEFKEYNYVKTALVNSGLSDFSETGLGGRGSLQGIPYKNIEEVADGACDFDKNGGDAQLPLLNGNLSKDCNGATQSILEAVNEHLQYFHEMDENCGEQNETPNLSVVGEIRLKGENESDANSCLLIHVTKGSPEKSVPKLNGACEMESKIAEMEDCQHAANGQSGIVQIRPVDGECDQLIDSEPMHDRTQVFELDRMCEDCITVSAVACSTEVNNISPESRPFCENANIENLHFTSQLCPMVQADSGSRGNDMLINNGCTISELQLRDDGSSGDPSMHYDVQTDVPGNFELEASVLTSSETNEMPCEDDGKFSEVSADINPNAKDSIGIGGENPSGPSQHTLLVQAVREFDHTNRDIEESHVEDAQLQFFDENLVYNGNNEHFISVANNQFSLVDDNINEQSHLSALQRPSLPGGVDSQHVNKELHLFGDWQPVNTACSAEINKKKLFEAALERCNIYASENNDSCHMQALPETKDRNVDVDEGAEFLPMGHAKTVSTDILPLVEVQFNHEVIAAEFDYSIKVSEDRITEAVDSKSDEHCSLSENSKLQATDNLTFHGRIPQGTESSDVSSLNSENFSEEDETNIIEKDEFPNADMQHQRKSGTSFSESSSKIIHLEKSATKSKLDIPTIKPPPNAAPFSDEWLAAIEAAGEEILTIKTGAVQNSPPDKPQHEPSPWSPVRRKNQAIGPFDCTKHTNISHSSS